MPAGPIATPRLTLVPCDAAMLSAVMRDEPLPGLRRHSEWPSDDLRSAIPLMLARLTERPETLGWEPWLIVVDGEIVGDIGGHGPPDASGTVEIGFSIVPAVRRRGIASEALGALLAWMRTHPAFRQAVARTHKDNVAAHGVLQRAGMRRDTIDGDLVVFTTA